MEREKLEELTSHLNAMMEDLGKEGFVSLMLHTYPKEGMLCLMMSTKKMSRLIEAFAIAMHVNADFNNLVRAATKMSDSLDMKEFEKKEGLFS